MSGLVGIVGAGIPLVREVQAMAKLLQQRDMMAPQIWHKALANGGSITLGYNAECGFLFKHEKIILWDGELHNRIELEKVLAAEGVPHCPDDKEKVIEAWHRWGPHSLEYFVGNYAFVIFDCMSCALYLARDSLGARPLFYTFDGEQWSFSSEIKSLTPVLKQPDYAIETLLPLLTYGATHSEKTYLSGVQRVLPGQVVTLMRDFTLQKQDIFSLRKQFSSPKKNNHPEEEVSIEAELKKIISTQCEKKSQPYVFFNEGFNAGLLGALTHSITGSAEAIVMVPTLKKEPLAGALAQRDQARMMAEHLKIPLREIEIKVDIAEDFPQLLSVAQEPFCSSSALFFHWFAQAAGQLNASSFLSALASDEIFSQGESYRLAYFSEQLRHAPQWIRHSLHWLNTPGLGRWMHPSMKVFDQVLSLSQFEADQAWQMSRCPFAGSLKEVFTAKKQEIGEAVSRDFWQFKSDAINRWSYLDLLYQIISGIIPNLEQQFSAQGKKILLPFLAEKIIHTALSISGDEKIETRWWKKSQMNQGALGKLTENYFPTALLMRPQEKIQLPLREWLKKDLSPWVQEYILSLNGLSGREGFDNKYLKKLVMEQATGRVDRSELLWRLLCLEHGFRQIR